MTNEIGAARIISHIETNPMTTLEQILSEFDTLQLGNFVNGLHLPCTREDYHDFIRTSFSKYQEELVAAVEKMKCDERKIVSFANWEAESYNEKMLVNAVLNQFIKLIKEN